MAELEIEYTYSLDLKHEETVVQKCPYPDLQSIVNYIYDEMKTNIKSKEAKEIKDKLDNIGPQSFLGGIFYTPKHVLEDCISFYDAAMLWKVAVKANAKWDHKPKIIEIFNNHWFCDKKGTESLKFKFDLWSNIHYGYVGRYVGFSQWTLINGAGIAQLGDNDKSLLSSETWIEYVKNRFVDFGDGDIFAGFDDASDMQAVKIGCRIYDQYKENISTQIILDELYKTYNNGKPLTIEKCEHHS